ncbi:MAG: metallophosphoesterase [Sinobacteraceae bacterium]|nr:metallophosphoesterase [Nevskiaceae bacterium]MBV9911272.1 metallophosphoesterase [Nevskiaceae bacterium]
MSVLRLIQFTDLHLYRDADQTLRGIATLPALKAALADAQSGAWPPDLVLLSGDLVQDDAGGYAQVRAVFGALDLPIACIPGNHDEPHALRRELSAPPFISSGHIDIGHWRLVLLDSCQPGMASGHLSAATLSQLDAALATAPNRHCLITLHHQPVPMGSRWLDRVGLENAADFFSIIDRHRNVRAIVWGHVHQAYDGLRKGVRLLATPSTCAQFVPHADEFAIDRRPPAYRTLELQSDGGLLTEVVWVEKRSAGSSASVCSAA